MAVCGVECSVYLRVGKNCGTEGCCPQLSIRKPFGGGLVLHMQKNNLYPAIVVLAAAAVMGLPSCVTPDPFIVSADRQNKNVYYVPPPSNVPMLTEKGDASINLQTGGGSGFGLFEMQAAYMAGEHLGVAAAFSQGFGGNFVKPVQYEVAAGYVKKLTHEWHFETYGGMGHETIDNSHYTGTSKVDARYFFLQPAFVVSNVNKSVQFGLVSRFSGVRFNVRDTLFYTDREGISSGYIGDLYRQPFHLMWEPALIFRFGWQNFQFHTGLTESLDLTNPRVHGATTQITFGMVCRLNTLKK